MDVGTEHEHTLNQNIDLSGRRILLAEDNELNWEVAKELLSDLGVELDWAEDGRICLDKFQKSPEGYYDIILMDIRMPHMTGYEATKAIRGLNHPDALSIPIIAMSADAFSDGPLAGVFLVSAIIAHRRQNQMCIRDRGIIISDKISSGQNSFTMMHASFPLQQACTLYISERDSIR